MLLDNRILAKGECLYCKSSNVKKWGRQSGLQRMRCFDCGKSFNALTGTPLAHLRKKDEWLKMAAALKDGLTVKDTAKKCNSCISTAFRWRHRFLKAMKSASLRLALRALRRSVSEALARSRRSIGPKSSHSKKAVVMLEEMQDGALRIKRIVNDLKDFARREEGAGKVLIDVNDASRKAVRLVEATIRKHTDYFSARYEDDLPLVWGNSQRIEQVVVNLVLNACQALPDKNRVIEITTHHGQGLPGGLSAQVHL